MPKALHYSLPFLFGLALCGGAAHAQEKSASAYQFEINPFFGAMLPSDFLGFYTSASGLGLRGHYVVSSGFAAEVGTFMWKKENDSGSTIDAGIYYEVQEDFRPYFTGGVHYTQLKLSPKFTNGEECLPLSCETDSGPHAGIYAGGGIIFPLSQMVPVKAGLRFYKGPSYWVLVDLGVGIRL